MNDELDARRQAKNRQRIGGALLNYLGGDEFEGTIVALTDTAPDAIRDAMADAFERGEMLHAMHVEESAREDRPGYCTNAVCRNWVQSEGEEEIPHASGAVEIRPTGRQSFCGLGDAEACGCLFRMKEQPPNPLDGVSCETLPQWAEAINMLRRAGLLEPDDYGKYNGTDFALQENVSILWWCLVDLLIETGRIKHSWVDEDMRDRGAESSEAKKLLFGSPLPAAQKALR